MNRRVLSLLRFLLILATILVMTYSRKGVDFGEPGYIIALIYFLSNLIVYRLPERYMSKSAFSFAVFLFDIIIISVAIYFTQGVETDFYLIYFLAIFMSSVGQSVGGSIPIAFVASIVYAWLIYRANPGISLLDSKFLIRIPFLFIISLASSYWSESTRREIKKKEELERFNRELEKEVERIAAKEIELRVYNEKIINSVASGIIAVNADGLVTTVNPEAERALGFTKDELVGYNIRKIPGIDALWTNMETSMQSGNPIIRAEVEIQNKNKDMVPIGFNVTPFSEPERHASGCVVIFKDLSELRKLEGKLKHAERLSYLGKMASWVAHEIRNPLTSIDGFAQLLQGNARKGKVGIYLAEIRKGTQRINHIVDDILTFARAKKVEYAKIDLQKLVESIVKDTKVKVVIRGEEASYIKGEAESIRRLFVNLISNSIEAMADNGVLEISFGYNDSWVTTTIRDNGKGIAEKDLKNLFTPFFTTKPRGTGLGLAIVKKIIDEHGGKIDVESTEGKGTTCNVYLPKFNDDKGNSGETTPKSG